MHVEPSSDRPISHTFRFHSDNSDRLASAGKDGQLFVWEVNEAEGPIATEQLLSVRISTAARAAASVRLAWHPASDDVIAFSAGRTVLLASVSVAGEGGDQVRAQLCAEQELIWAFARQMV